MKEEEFERSKTETLDENQPKKKKFKGIGSRRQKEEEDLLKEARLYYGL